MCLGAIPETSTNSLFFSPSCIAQNPSSLVADFVLYRREVAKSEEIFMTKEEIKQKFFDVISAKLSYSAKTDEIKDLSKAFKNVCDTEYDDSLLTELSKIPTDKQGQVKI